jgi:hypothetical protein
MLFFIFCVSEIVPYIILNAWFLTCEVRGRQLSKILKYIRASEIRVVKRAAFGGRGLIRGVLL